MDGGMNGICWGRGYQLESGRDMGAGAEVSLGMSLGRTEGVGRVRG